MGKKLTDKRRLYPFIKYEKVTKEFGEEDKKKLINIY